MADTDITKLIERLDGFEEKLGVRLESMSAFLDDQGDNIFVTVNGELQSRDNTELKQNIELVLAVYDKLGRIVGTESSYFSKEDFCEFETFNFLLGIPVNKLSKIRVYPKKSD